MEKVGEEAWQEAGRELAEFARRFRQVMVEETRDLEASNRTRYWEAVRALSLLQTALDQGDGSDPAQAGLLLKRMRVALEGYAGRRADSEPYRRAQSVEERNWYVQWSGMGSDES